MGVMPINAATHRCYSGINVPILWMAAAAKGFDQPGLLRSHRPAGPKVWRLPNKHGVYRGRPPKIDMEGIKERLANGLLPTAIARDLDISRGTVYKAKAAVPSSSKALR